MNLFITHCNPDISAQALDDKRLIKQVLECGQLLSTALRQRGSTLSALYKATHWNHPVTKWVGQTSGNFFWTIDFIGACANEYTFRFSKRHATLFLLPDIIQEKHLIPHGPLLPFQNSAANSSLGLDFTDIQEPALAYKKYLMAKWALEQPKWTKRERPVWNV